MLTPGMVAAGGGRIYTSNLTWSGNFDLSANIPIPVGFGYLSDLYAVITNGTGSNGIYTFDMDSGAVTFARNLSSVDPYSSWVGYAGSSLHVTRYDNGVLKREGLSTGTVVTQTSNITNFQQCFLSYTGLYLFNRTGIKTLTRRTLTTAFDLSTVPTSSTSYTLNQIGTMSGFGFSLDGLLMFVLHDMSGTRYIDEYSLSPAFNPSVAALKYRTSLGNLGTGGPFVWCNSAKNKIAIIGGSTLSRYTRA